MIIACVLECNKRTCLTNGLTAVLLVPGLRGNGGSVLGYHSFLTTKQYVRSQYRPLLSLKFIINKVNSRS